MRLFTQESVKVTSNKKLTSDSKNDIYKLILFYSYYHRNTIKMTILNSRHSISLLNNNFRRNIYDMINGM